MTILATLPLFLVYFALASLLMIAFVLIYTKITPYDEFALIKQGQIAPAISLSGAILGFVIALASVIKNSVDLVDMVAWGVVAGLVQLLAFAVVRLFFRGLTDGINQNNIAKALMLGVVAVAFGMLNAACMTY